jgi:hypothetical protein
MNTCGMRLFENMICGTPFCCDIFIHSANATLIEESKNPQVREKLKRFFRPHNKLLDELLTNTFKLNASGYSVR